MSEKSEICLAKFCKNSPLKPYAKKYITDRHVFNINYPPMTHINKLHFF